ncbi:TolC family protein [Flammeovirga sp. OC4]|uniref:TolC family protein n=1 Tax=Flammeovirga sp. OC4 TaxID=1382345 RepID=UPI00155D966D|nr:TolC family protein [Flammeovirga sp. OC4]
MKKLFSMLIMSTFSFSLLGQSYQSLTLSNAIAKTLQNNYDIKIDQQEVSDAKQKNTWGNAGKLPQINLSNNNRGTVQVNQPASPFSLEGQNDNIQLDVGIDLQWTLFNGQRVRFRKEQLDNEEQLALLRHQLIMENKVEEVIFQYYKVLLEQEKLNVLIKIQQNAEHRIQRIEKGVQLGENSKFELTREKTTYFTDSINLVDQKLKVESDLQQLNYILGEEDINTPYQLTDSLEVPTLDLSASSVFDKVNTQNNQLGVINTQLRQQQVNVQLSKTNKIPTVSLESAYQGNLNWLTADYPTIEGELITQTNKGHLYGGFIGINVTVPVFNGGQNERKIQSSKIQFHKKQLEQKKKKLELKKEFHQLFSNYHYNQEKVRIGYLSQKSAEENLQLSQEQLDLGSISVFDFRQVQNSYMNASLNYFTAQYELILSQVRLLKISGEILK